VKGSKKANGSAAAGPSAVPVSGWVPDKPRQRAADRRRRFEKAEANYRAMPTLRSGPTGVSPANSGRRPPNPPGGVLGNQCRTATLGYSSQRASDSSPCSRDPDRKPFDCLLTDPRYLRSDVRMVRSAIRRNSVRPEDRGLLVEKLGRLLELYERRDQVIGPRGTARMFFAAARGVLDVHAQCRGLLRQLGREEYGHNSRGPLPRRLSVWDGVRFDARTFRLDASRSLRAGVGQVRFEHGIGASAGTTVVNLVGVPQYRQVFECPRCGRRCRYVYPCRGGVGCRRCARRTYRVSRASEA